MAEIKKFSKFNIMLILFILIGVFFRAYNLNYPFIGIDDEIIAVSALKLHHQSWKEGVSYVWGHPPLGKYVAGIFTIFMPDSKFEVLKNIPPQMFGWRFLANEVLRETIFLIRLSSLFSGLLIILLGYLIMSKIYSHSVGLWSAVLVSLSLDFISFSRTIYTEHFMNLFTLLCIYFYISYAYTSEKKLPSLFGFFISLIFLVNTRLFQPAIIALTFLLHFLILDFSKTKNLSKTIINTTPLFAVYGLTIFLTLAFIYTPLPPEQFAHKSLLSFGFNPLKILEVLIFRNSYLALFGLLLSIGLLIFSRKEILKKYKTTPKLKYISDLKFLIPFFFIISLISFLPFNFSYTFLTRYSSFILLFFLMVLAAVFYTFENKFKNFFRVVVLGVLILASWQIYQASQDHPPFVANSNFNIEKYATIPDARGTGYNDSIYDYLFIEGNPPIITNIGWLSIFYNGKIFYTPIPNSNLCSHQYFDLLKEENALLIVIHPDFFTGDTWSACEEFKRQNFSLEKEFILIGKERNFGKRTINIYNLD